MTPTSYVDFRDSLEAGDTTCVAETRQFIDRCRSSKLNAFVHLDETGALDQAAALDETDRSSLPLAGMVVGIKDVISCKGSPLSCGSRMLSGFTSPFDATAVERLRSAGAIILGKLNCDEFAMGSSNETSAFGPVRNPVNPEYVPGGSSGGSAAAVKAGLCHVALGSDTGGSIRQPSSFCGVVGLKPTYGRVSRFGLVAFASSLDSIGPIGNSIDDVWLVHQTIAGHDAKDATSADVPLKRVAFGSGQSDNLAGLRLKSQDPKQTTKPLRVGVPREYFDATDGLDTDVLDHVRQQIKKLEGAGAEVVDVSLPHTRFGVATYYIIASAEASSNLARYDGVRFGFRASTSDPIFENLVAETRNGDPDISALDAMYTASRTIGFGEEVKRRIMLGTFALSSGYHDAYYDKAQRVRTLIRKDFDNAFTDVDMIVTPVAPTPAFKLGDRISDVLEMYLGDIFTIPSSLAGLPGVSIPTGQSHDGLPIGLQLLGPAFSEEQLLSTSKFLMGL